MMTICFIHLGCIGMLFLPLLIIPIVILWALQALLRSVAAPRRRRQYPQPVRYEPGPEVQIFKVKPGQELHIVIDKTRTWTQFKTKKGGRIV